MSKRHLGMGIFLFSSAACGGSVSGGPTDGSTSSGPTPIQSIDSTKKFSELTPQDLQKLCQDLGAYVTTQALDIGKAFTCAFSGLVAGNASGSFNSATCHSTYDQCVQQPTVPDAGSNLTPTFDVMNCATMTNPGALATCQGTIGEYNTCVQETFATLKNIGSILCDNPDAGPQVFEPTTPSPSCQAFQQQCPGFSSSGSDAAAP